MMDCTRLDEVLAEYLAGRLAEDEAADLEQHAAECARCAPRLEEATRLPGDWRREVAPPPAVRTEVLAAIRPRRAAAPPVPRWFIPAVAAAIVLVVLNLGAPRSKSGQVPLKSPSAAMAAERADEQFKALDAAEEELTAALRDRPDTAVIRQALTRVAAQRRALESLVKEYDS